MHQRYKLPRPLLFFFFFLLIEIRLISYVHASELSLNPVQPDTTSALTSGTAEPDSPPLSAEPDESPVAASIQIQYLNGKTCRLGVGQSRRIYYQIIPEPLPDATLLWSSENPDIADVDQTGLITAKSPGTACITLGPEEDTLTKTRITVLVENRRRQNSSTEQGLTIVNTLRSRYTYNDMKEDLYQLQDRYGDCLKVTTLGLSYDKRTLYMAILGNPSASHKILIQSAIHGREHMTSQLTMKQIEFYCRNYYSGVFQNQYFSEIFEDTAFYIVPMSNPDGVTISQYGLDGIRSGTLRRNLRLMCEHYAGGRPAYFTQWKSNARGVDLNRNFAAYWPFLQIRSTHPSAYFYKGTKPESEIETQTLVQLVNTIKPSATISYHATGSILYWDYGQKGGLRNTSYSLVNAIRDLTGYHTVHGFNKRFSTGFSDWVSIKKHTPAVTIEIGTGSCPLKSSEFPAIWRQNKMLYVTLTELQ